MTALVPLDSRLCPDCGAEAGRWVREQDALFVHGGYGATRRHTIAYCSEGCGWSVTAEVTETRPPRPTRR